MATFGERSIPIFVMISLTQFHVYFINATSLQKQPYLQSFSILRTTRIQAATPQSNPLFCNLQLLSIQNHVIIIKTRTFGTQYTPSIGHGYFTYGSIWPFCLIDGINQSYGIVGLNTIFYVTLKLLPNVKILLAEIEVFRSNEYEIFYMVECF